MPRLIVLDISPATDRHCGDGRGRFCRGVFGITDHCRPFRAKLTWSDVHGEYFRLPECIAAEQRAKS